MHKGWVHKEIESWRGRFVRKKWFWEGVGVCITGFGSSFLLGKSFEKTMSTDVEQLVTFVKERVTKKNMIFFLDAWKTFLGYWIVDWAPVNYLPINIELFVVILMCPNIIAEDWRSSTSRSIEISTVSNKTLLKMFSHSNVFDFAIIRGDRCLINTVANFAISIERTGKITAHTQVHLLWCGSGSRSNSGQQLWIVVTYHIRLRILLVVE